MPRVEELVRHGAPIHLAESTISRVIEDLDKIYTPALIPQHFLRSTFPRIGGRMEALFDERKIIAYGFAFPDGDHGEKTRGYWIEPQDGRGLPIGWYDAKKKANKEFDAELVTGKMRLLNTLVQKESFSMWYPDKRMAEGAQELQNRVWKPKNGRKGLYPADFFADNATNLVVTNHIGNVVGFLFGFYGRGNKWLGDKDGSVQFGTWIESQLMATGESVRQYGIGASLKFQQLKEAKEKGIKLIHWTYDPLLAANAGLNLNTLGAVVAEFTPNYYPDFSNDLNVVPASRFGVYWLTESGRTSDAFMRWQRKIGDLPGGYPPSEIPSFEEISSSSNTLIINPLQDCLDDKLREVRNNKPASILVKIPKNWQGLQDEAKKKRDYSLVVQWRNNSDEVFKNIIGTGEGKYVITAVTKDTTGEPYLFAQQFKSINFI